MRKKCVRCNREVPRTKYGRRRKYCKTCSKKVIIEQRHQYYLKNKPKIKKYAMKWRREHRAEIRIQSREWSRKKREEELKATEQFLDDVFANPRKYLKRV